MKIKAYNFLNLILCFFLITINIFAQNISLPISDIVGKKVRVYAPDITGDWIKGKVEYFSTDTLKLTGRNLTIDIPLKSIELLELNIVPDKSLLKPIIKGGFIGAAIGTSVGFIFWGINQNSNTYYFNEQPPSRSSYVITRAAIGGVLGMIAGAIIGKSGEKWKKYPIEELKNK